MAKSSNQVIKDLAILDAGNDSRLSMAAQPYEPFAWVHVYAWIANRSRGFCGNPKCRCELSFDRPHETADDIMEELGKERRGQAPNAFTAQRRYDRIVHVQSNIAGALCNSCNSNALMNLTVPDYEKLGGPEAHWLDAVGSGLASEPIQGRMTMQTLSVRVRTELERRGLTRCYRRTCNRYNRHCEYHIQYRKLFDEMAQNLCGQSGEELRSASREEQRGRRCDKKGASQEEDPSESDDPPGPEPSDDDSEMQEATLLRHVHRPPRKRVVQDSPSADNTDDIEDSEKGTPPLWSGRDARAKAREVARAASEVRAADQDADPDPVMSPSPPRNMRPRKQQPPDSIEASQSQPHVQDPMLRAAHRATKRGRLQLAASTGQACSHAERCRQHPQTPLVRCHRPDCGNVVHLRCFAGQTPRLAAMCHLDVAYCFTCASALDRP